jgi:proline iminopeptidase
LLLAADVWDKLAGKHGLGVIRDPRGTGRSVPLNSAKKVKFVDQVSDLEAIRQALNAEKINLLGWDYGAIEATAYAIQHPECVSHLILCDSAGVGKFNNCTTSDNSWFHPELDSSDGGEMGCSYLSLTEGDETASAIYHRCWLESAVFEPKRRSEAQKQTSLFRREGDVSDPLSKFDQYRDVKAELANLKMPVLILHGRWDSVCVPAIAFELNDLIPGSELNVFALSEHMPFVDEPDAFVQTVDEFLSR